MLGLFLLYFIGKKFAELAEEFKKTKWHYVVLGIVSFYIGTIVLGMLLLGLLDILGLINLDTIHDRILDFIVLPFGLLSCYLFYMYLEKKWKKQVPKIDKMIGEIGVDTKSIE